MNKEQLRLSRTLSHALRHEPWIYELELDVDGWVDLEMLLSSFREKRTDWQTLTEADVREVMALADKRRFELTDGRIRALYGHSTRQRLRKNPATPPHRLFHGTSPEVVAVILEQGLRPMGRQYVHLSSDLETAQEVGARKASEPAMLEVAATDAHAAGVVFYEGNEKVWLADVVPAAFLRRTS